MNWSLSKKKGNVPAEADSVANGTPLSAKKSIQVAVRLSPEHLAWLDGEVVRLQEMLPEANRSNVLRSLVHAAMKKQDGSSKQPTSRPTRGK